MSQDALVEAIALWAEAVDRIAASKRTRAELQASRHQCRIRRLLRLATGASDVDPGPTTAANQIPLETWTRRCPSCHSDVVAPMGHVTWGQGLVKIDMRCGACKHLFVFVHKNFD